MKLSTNNFTSAIKQIIVGGKSAVSGAVASDAGFLRDAQSVLPNTTSAAGQTALPVRAFVIPRDYDEAADNLSITFQGRSAGATDTPAVTLTVIRTRAGVADSTLLTSGAVLTLSATQQSATVDLSGNDLQRGDLIRFAFVAGAHTTDAIERIAAVPTYRSTLVSYDQLDASGNPLR